MESGSCETANRTLVKGEAPESSKRDSQGIWLLVEV